GEHILGHPVPSLVSLLFSGKDISTQQRVLAVPRSGEEKRSEVGECSIDVAVTLDLRQTAVKAESVRNQTGAQPNRIFQGVVRTDGIIQLCISLGLQAGGLNV